MSGKTRLHGSSKSMIRDVRRDLDHAYAGLFRLTYPGMTDEDTQLDLIRIQQEVSQLLIQLREYEKV